MVKEGDFVTKVGVVGGVICFAGGNDVGGGVIIGFGRTGGVEGGVEGVSGEGVVGGKGSLPSQLLLCLLPMRLPLWLWWLVWYFKNDLSTPHKQ